MSKIHYLSHHSILEYDEVSLFTELGHDVFSNGAYIDPRGHITLPRPGIKGAIFHEDLAKIVRDSSKTQLPPELIEPFDTFVIMSGGGDEVLFANWEKIKHKRVIWRTIGQSLPHIETRVAALRKQGLQVVRYSPMERNLGNFAGEDALIRFYKDPEEFGNWRGTDKSVINASQALKGRRDFCGYEACMAVAKGLPFFVSGNGNEDLGPMALGELSYDRFKDRLRDHRVFFYSGTWPASYTLSFIEAWMTGIPVVSVGKSIFNKHQTDERTFEIPELIKTSYNGYVSNDAVKLRKFIKWMLEDDVLAAKVSARGRKEAIKVFGKETIKEQWKEFLK